MSSFQPIGSNQYSIQGKGVWSSPSLQRNSSRDSIFQTPRRAQTQISPPQGPQAGLQAHQAFLVSYETPGARLDEFFRVSEVCLHLLRTLVQQQTQCVPRNPFRTPPTHDKFDFGSDPAEDPVSLDSEDGTFLIRYLNSCAKACLSVLQDASPSLSESSASSSSSSSQHTQPSLSSWGPFSIPSSGSGSGEWANPAVRILAGLPDLERFAKRQRGSSIHRPSHSSATPSASFNARSRTHSSSRTPSFSNLSQAARSASVQSTPPIAIESSSSLPSQTESAASQEVRRFSISVSRVETPQQSSSHTEPSPAQRLQFEYLFRLNLPASVLGSPNGKSATSSSDTNDSSSNTGSPLPAGDFTPFAPEFHGTLDWEEFQVGVRRHFDLLFGSGDHPLGWLLEHHVRDRELWVQNKLQSHPEALGEDWLKQEVTWLRTLSRAHFTLLQSVYKDLAKTDRLKDLARRSVSDAVFDLASTGAGVSGTGVTGLWGRYCHIFEAKDLVLNQRISRLINLNCNRSPMFENGNEKRADESSSPGKMDLNRSTLSLSDLGVPAEFWDLVFLTDLKEAQLRSLQQDRYGERIPGGPQPFWETVHCLRLLATNQMDEAEVEDPERKNDSPNPRSDAPSTPKSNIHSVTDSSSGSGVVGNIPYSACLQKITQSCRLISSEASASRNAWLDLLDSVKKTAQDGIQAEASPEREFQERKTSFSRSQSSVQFDGTTETSSSTGGSRKSSFSTNLSQSSSGDRSLSLSKTMPQCTPLGRPEPPLGNNGVIHGAQLRKDAAAIKAKLDRRNPLAQWGVRLGRSESRNRGPSAAAVPEEDREWSFGGADNLTCDDLIPILAYCLCYSGHRHLTAQTQFLLDLTEADQLLGEVGFALTTFQCAVEHLGSLDIEDMLAQRAARASAIEDHRAKKMQQLKSSVLKQAAVVQCREAQATVVIRNPSLYNSLPQSMFQYLKSAVTCRDRLLQFALSRSEYLALRQAESMDPRDPSEGPAAKETLDSVDGLAPGAIPPVQDSPAANFLGPEIPEALSWKFAFEKRGVRVYRLLNPQGGGDHGVHTFKGEGVIPAPPQTVWEFLMNIQNRKLYDSMYEGGDYFGQVADDVLLAHMRFKARTWCSRSERDFSVVHHWFRTDLPTPEGGSDLAAGVVNTVRHPSLSRSMFGDRSSENNLESFRDTEEEAGEDSSRPEYLDRIWSVCAKSVVHPELPPQSGYTRANIMIGGWVLRGIAGLPGFTRACYAAQLDPGGRIPNWLANKITQNQPLCVYSVAKYFKNLQQTAVRSQQRIEEESGGDLVQ